MRWQEESRYVLMGIGILFLLILIVSILILLGV